MEISELKTKIGKPGGVYLFAGEEDYLKRFYLESLAAALFDPSLASLCKTVFDGGEIDVAALGDALRAPPFMGDGKLVVWKYPDFTKMDAATKKDLVSLLAAREEYPYSTLVFLTTEDGFPLDGGAKMKTKLYKEWEKVFDIVIFDHPKESELLAWIKRHFEAGGVRVDLPTAKAFVARTGTSMDVLSSEIDKLSALVKSRGGDVLTVADVNEAATPTDEVGAFALSDAVLSCDRTLALRALAKRRADRDDPMLVFGILSRIFADLSALSGYLSDGVGADAAAAALGMNAYKAKLYAAAAKKMGPSRICRAVDALAEADLALKFGTRDGYAVLDTFLSQNLF